MTRIAENDSYGGADGGERPVRAPLSGSQLRLWYMSQLSPGNPFYNVTIALRIEGRIDIGALCQALRDLVQRHEILRTRYPVEGGRPLQEVVALRDWQVHCETRLRDDRRLQERELQHCAERIARSEIRLDEGPLFRAHLLTVAEDLHGLVLLTHHITIDQKSINILMDELDAIYGARLAGKRAELPRVPSYREFSAWHARRIGERDPELLGYSERILVVPPQPLPLPRERPSRGDEMRLGKEHRFQIDSVQTQMLRALCRRTRTTPSMVLLAVFSALLHRYSARRRFFVGTTTAFRGSSKFARTIGCFINTLALPITIETADTFESFLVRTRNSVLDAFSHYELSYERLVELARSSHQGPHVEFINTYFQFKPPILSTPTNGSRRFSPNIHVHNGRAKFPFMLNASDRQHHIDCTFEYDELYFTETSIRTIAPGFCAALVKRLQHPGSEISGCPIQLDTAGWIGRDESTCRTSPAPEDDAPNVADSDLCSTELKLADLWFDLLGRRPTHKSGDFFALGGHSLMTAQLAWRIRESFTADVRIADLQRSSRLAEMARLIELAPRYAKRSAAPAPANRLTMLGGLPCQLELGSWKLDQLEHLLANRGDASACNHLHRIAWTFLGTPFQFESRRPLPLGNRLPIRLGTFDCFTFVLTTIALAAARDLDEFAGVLAALRYKGSRERAIDSDPETGTIFDFAEEALLVNAVERGLLNDVTREIAAGAELEFVQTCLSPVRRAATMDPLELWATPKLRGLTLSASFIPRVAFDRFGDSNLLRNGDIVLMSRGGSPGGQIIDHLGLVHIEDGRTHLLQSTRHYAYHPPPGQSPPDGEYTGIFYDDEKRCEQIGVGIGGGYLGDEFTLYQGDLPLFGYRRGERRLLSDYLQGAFKQALVLRPNF